MSTQRSHQRLRSGMATWKAGVRLGRLATVLAAIISGLLASVAAATAAFAQPTPVGDGGTTSVVPVPATTVRIISAGGMAGWQIALVAVGAALAGAAAVAVIDRARNARRASPAPTA